MKPPKETSMDGVAEELFLKVSGVACDEPLANDYLCYRPLSCYNVPEEVRLRDAFDSYLSFCRQVRDRMPPGTGSNRPGPRDADRIRACVEEAEASPLFKTLVDRTKSKFVGPHHKSTNDSFWLSAVGNWFRNSRYYTNLFGSVAPPDTENLLRSYVGAFARERDVVRWFAPIELVNFAGPLEFDTFKILVHEADDLRGLLRNDVNELFYPWAVTTLSVLEDYWFVEVQQEKEAHRVGHFELPGWERMFFERRKFSEFPACLESALQKMALFRWIPDWFEEDAVNWFGFNVPFAIKVEGSLLRSPARAPELARLDREPIADQEGNEVDDRPAIIHDLDEVGTKHFGDFICGLETLWALPEKWAFIDLARGYLLKAFLTKGLEQLLWHITALEALVGEKEQTVRTLKNRLSCIHGSTEKERKAVKKQVADLYGVRCDLVHGNVRKSEKVDVALLRDARELARATVLWFLKYAAHIRSNMAKDSLPEREDLLAVLDMDKRRGMIARVIECVPPGFPNVPGWKA